MEYTMFTKKSYATDVRNLGRALQLVKENLESVKKGYKVYNILSFGRLLEGQAYYHEVDRFYNCVGIEVEIESQIEFDHEGKTLTGELERATGFYSIWRGRASSYAPVTFETGYGQPGNLHRFDNGCGDHIDVTRVIFGQDVVQAVVKKLDLLP